MKKERTDNHLVINHDINTWGRGHSFQEALKNSKGSKKHRMTYILFANDKWEFFTDGTLQYNPVDVLHRTTFNI